MRAWYVEGAEQREAYLRFAEYMLNESDAFSLVYFRYSESEALKKSARRVKNLLEPLKIYAQNVNEWPSMITLNENSHIYRLTVYRAEAGGDGGAETGRFPLGLGLPGAPDGSVLL